MRFFQQRERNTVDHSGQPKVDRDDPLQQELDEINRLQRAIYKLVRVRGGAALQSSILLDEKKCEGLCRLRDQYGVLPIIDSKSGYWYLYSGTQK